MESLTYLLKLTVHNISMLGGAVFCLLILSIFILLKLNIHGKTSRLIEYACGYSTPVFFFVYLMMGVLYLFYPNYLSHIEPTVAWLGVLLKSGGCLYPVPLGSYPYYGILYGPALFEIQMVFQGLGLPTLVSSKLPGLIAFTLSSLILIRLNKNWLYRGYLLYLFPFGLMLFFNRAEPFLLLIVSVSLFLGNNCADRKYLPILMGIFGGAASALKMHGVAYIFAAYLAVILTAGVSISSVLFFSISSALSFLAFFIPQNVSIIAFWGYLKLAGVHGLSLRLWIENLIYLIFLLSPLLTSWRGDKLERSARVNLILILGVELCITIIAAKPGAGFYHLLPLIPINVFIFQKIFSKALYDKSLIKVLYVSLITVSLVTVLLDFLLPMVKSWRQFNEAQKEVVYFEKKYPNVIMGVTNNHGYPYSFLRVMLKSEQIDYAAFMDLQISGIGDEVFAENLKNCRICCILLPNIGDPFTLNNYYTFKPLFSEKIREAFTSKYNRVEIGKYYSLYTRSMTAKSIPP